jgi:hypothetical protein
MHVSSPQNREIFYDEALNHTVVDDDDDKEIVEYEVVEVVEDDEDDDGVDDDDFEEITVYSTNDDDSSNFEIESQAQHTTSKDTYTTPRSMQPSPQPQPPEEDTFCQVEGDSILLHCPRRSSDRMSELTFDVSAFFQMSMGSLDDQLIYEDDEEDEDDDEDDGKKEPAARRHQHSVPPPPRTSVASC